MTIIRLLSLSSFLYAAVMLFGFFSLFASNVNIVMAQDVDLGPEVKPLASFPLPIQGKSYALGVTSSVLKGRVASDWRSDGIGVNFQYLETLSPFFEGSLGINWDRWELKHKNIENESEDSDTLAPMLVKSGVAIGSKHIGGFFRPALSFSLGSLLFFQDRTAFVKRSSVLPSDIMVSLGLEGDFVLQDALAARFSMVSWRGVKSKRYFGNSYGLTIRVGNVLVR